MYTYLKLKNFKSFNDVEFNFKKSKNEAKNLVAIYGENGCGKTNFVLAYQLLTEILTSLVNEKMLEKIQSNQINIANKLQNQPIVPVISIFQNLLLNLQMKQSKEATEVEYGFTKNNKDGYYKIKFHDGKIIYEELYYIANTNRASLFKIEKQNDVIKQVNFHNTLIIDKEYEKELLKRVDQYWGNFSFLSIIVSEMTTKNKEYIEKSLSKNLLEVINLFIKETNVNIKTQSGEMFKLSGNEDRVLASLAFGIINKKEKYKLEKYEKILNEFFVNSFSEIKHVYYKKEEKDDAIEYELIFEKQINNKIMEIEFKDESTGTQSLIVKLNNLISALDGNCAIIDEIDTGIHDLLMQKIIESIKDKITGQIIFTTHNTLLLETLKPENIYVIVTDNSGNKVVKCLNDFDMRLQKNNNIRNLYLNGIFGGIPFIGDIDFETIKEEYKDINNKEEIKK